MKQAVGVSEQIQVLKYAPNAEDLCDLKAQGFRSVVNLRTAGESGEVLTPHEEQKEAERLGLSYVSFPSTPASLTSDAIDRLQAMTKDLPSPFAVHCASGRRAAMVGLALYARDEGHDAKAAATKGREIGLQVDEDALRQIV